jgi:hypothetical protein
MNPEINANEAGSVTRRISQRFVDERGGGDLDARLERIEVSPLRWLSCSRVEDHGAARPARAPASDKDTHDGDEFPTLASSYDRMGTSSPTRLAPALFTLDDAANRRRRTMTEHGVGTRVEWPVARQAVVLLGAALVAWAVTVERMRGMDAGPGTDLGGLGWYLGVWVTMTAAMMLPSAAPAALLVARASRGLPTLFFAAGYLAVWTAFGLAAYGLFRLVTSFDTGWLAWDGGGPYVAGGTIVAAGIYELTPLKEHCLRRCRNPLHDVRHGERGLRVGLENGLFCAGCCWGLMAALFALGVMSIFWMVVVAGVIFAEKVLPQGIRFPRIVAPALVALGVWLAVAPSSVPGLTEPDGAPAMQMKM